MDQITPAYVLLGLLAIGLAIAFVTDLRARIIPNWLNGAIVATAPLYWWASGDALWPDVPIHLAVGLGVFFVFAMFFRFGLMEGGDVKLLGALGLWLDFQATYDLILFSSLIGVAVSLIFWAVHKARKAAGRAEIPFGIAISIAGIWVLSERYFNHFV